MGFRGSVLGVAQGCLNGRKIKQKKTSRMVVCNTDKRS